MRTIGSDIILYDASGAIITIAPFTSGSVHKAELMKDDYITVKFIFESFVSFGVGCYAMYGGKRYILRNAYEPDRNTDGLFVYELKFEVEWMRLGDLIMFYTKTGIKEAEWSLTGNPAAFLQLIVDYAKEVTGINYVLGSVTPHTSITVSFSSSNILDALTSVAKACSEAESYTSQAEWWFDGFILNLTRCEVGTRVDFIEGNAVQRMEPQKSDSDEEFTRLYAFGSTRNIPTDYRAGTEDEQFATISKRLRLPEGIPFIDSKEGLTDDEVIESVKLFEEIYPREIIPVTGVLFSEETDDNGIRFNRYFVKQDTLALTEACFENATPSITFQTGRLAGRTFEVKYWDSLSDAKAYSLFKTHAFEYWKSKILEWESIHSQDKPQSWDAWLIARSGFLISNARIFHNNPAWNGTAAEFVAEMFDYWASVAITVWSLNNPAITIFNYTTNTGAFDNVSRVAFASWKSMLSACEASDWNHAYSVTWDQTFAGYDLVCQFGETVFSTANASGKLFEIINTVIGTTYMPNAVLCPEVDATFVLFNFDISLVSAQYISDAENELLAAAQEYMAYKIANKKNYSCPTNAPYCAQNEIDLEIGRRVRLYGDVFGSYRDSRIFSFEKALDTLGKATYLVGDSSNYSRSKALDGKVESLSIQVYNQTSSVGGLKVIKMLDSTAPNDENVLSSTRTLFEIKKSAEESISIPTNQFGQTIGLEKVVSDGTVIISIKLEDATPQTVDDGHIAILTNNNGELHGEAYWVDE